MTTLRFYQLVSEVDHEGETHRGFFLTAEAALSVFETLDSDSLGQPVLYRCTVAPDSHTREEVTRKKLSF